MTPKLRFPEFTHDWFEAWLQDEYDYKNAKAHEPYVVENGRYKLINSKFISTEGKKFRTVDSVLTKASVGDVTMVLSDLPNGKALAKAYYIEEDDTYAINQRICRLRVLDEQKNDSKFFYYLINRNSYFLRLDDGITQTHISKGDVLNFRYNTTQLNEQTRIRDLFNCVDKKINLLTKKKEALETYKKGLMQKIFSQELRFKREDGTDYPEWRLMKLVEVCSRTNSGLAKGDLYNVGLNGVYGAAGELEGYTNVPSPSSAYVSIVKDGAGVGRVNFLPPNTSTIGTLDMIVADEESVLPYFIYTVLNNIKWGKYIVGSTIPHIYFRDWKSEKVHIPSLEEQNKIVKVISNLESNCHKIIQKIESTEQLKKGLLQQMFV